MALKKKAKAKRIRPRKLKSGEKLKPGRLGKGATAKEIEPANLIVEVLTQHRALLVAAYDDWNAKMIDGPIPLPQKLREDATFVEQRMAGIPTDLGAQQADFLLKTIRERLKVGK